MKTPLPALLIRVIPLVLLACFATGCKSILGPEGSEGGPSDLPWSEPADWEGNTFGLPY